MRPQARRCLTVLAIISAFAAGCTNADSKTRENKGSRGLLGLFTAERVKVPSGASIEVRLGQSLSSETANRGDHWQGVVVNPVVIDGREAIPSGATVEGIVVATEEAKRGSRARLQLGVRSVQVGDHKTALSATSEPVIAGSPRARNLGAIAGGAAAGAIIGEATNDAPGTGAIIGGAIAGGAVAASKGYQVVLKDGTVMTFTVREDVSVRVG